MPEAQLDDFKVSHFIGKGAYGEVYLAQRQQDDEKRLVAIKSVNKAKLATNDKAMRSAILEHQICFRGRQPNLCTMDYFFSTDERLYFVMPFYRGGNLREYLKNQTNGLGRIVEEE